ncbi:MAG: hypothetical protein VYD19_01275 [Myxococcota bacterium]|nr:hypothetical protein [Myxococcota bacterium]
MLNLYLVPRARPTFSPPPTATAALISWLIHQGVARETGEHNRLSPGLSVSTIFDRDAHRELVPAALSFLTLHLKTSPRPTVLPRHHEVPPHLSCKACGDLFPPEKFEQLERGLALFSPEEFSSFCLSCQTERSLRELDFEPALEIASFWIEIEAIGTSRISVSWLRRVERLIGAPLSVLLETPPRDDGFSPWDDDEASLDGEEGAGWGGGWAEPKGRALRDARAQKHRPKRQRKRRR